MTNTNPHTGARLVSKGLTEEGKKNFDIIFGKQVSHVQLFSGVDAEKRANEFLTQSAKDHPDFEYIINFQGDGILVTGKKIS